MRISLSNGETVSDYFVDGGGSSVAILLIGFAAACSVERADRGERKVFIGKINHSRAPAGS